METKQEEKLNDVLEIVSFIKDNAASKEDFNKLSVEIAGIKETMATKDDLGKLSVEVVNIKETMATKKDLDELREQFSRLIESIDNYSKKVDDYYMEMLATGGKLERHEKWIQQLANKFDIKLEY